MKLKLLPRLVVFDLDHTLWPFGVDQFVFKPPYRKNNGSVVDSTNAPMAPFPDSSKVLQYLNDENIDVGLASRTEYPPGALQLIQLFGWEKWVKYKEIYPGSKLAHFAKFKQLTNLTYNHMLFFDDEPRNIEDIGPLGVTSILVDPNTGVTFDVLKHGFQEFENKQRNRG